MLPVSPDRCRQALAAFVFSPRRISLLERLRRRLRHAWLLHFSLILSLLLLPVGRLARADGGSGFTLTGTESTVSVSVWASEGMMGMESDSSRQVIANVQLNTWEVWTDAASGISEIRNPLRTPIPGAFLNFSASGDGLVFPETGNTDANGSFIAWFTMGSADSRFTVTEGGSGATGSDLFRNAVSNETWTWDHDESNIAATLSATDSTDNVPNGETRSVSAHVEFSTWSVYASDLGNTAIGYSGTSPAIGAQVFWTIENGDGSVDPGSSDTVGSGDAVATFTMGSSTSIVHADVSFAATNSTVATLQFTPAGVEETWTFDHAESSVSAMTVSADGSTDALDPGAQRNVTAAVTADS